MSSPPSSTAKSLLHTPISLSITSQSEMHSQCYSSLHGHRDYHLYSLRLLNDSILSHAKIVRCNLNKLNTL